MLNNHLNNALNCLSDLLSKVRDDWSKLKVSFFSVLVLFIYKCLNKNKTLTKHSQLFQNNSFNPVNLLPAPVTHKSVAEDRLTTGTCYWTPFLTEKTTPSL